MRLWGWPWGAVALCVWGAGRLGKVPQGSMGRLWSTLRVITPYCSPSPWCHKMDDVMLYNINSPAAGWLIPSMGCKRCRSSPNICGHARGTNTELQLLPPAFLKGKIKTKGEPQWKYQSDFLPCNTGNPNQNHLVRTLCPNYRHEMHMTQLLVAGVISSSPQTHTGTHIHTPPHPVLF